MKPDSKVLKMLQGQVETLQTKKSEVEQHLERTEAWVEHLGQWSVHVHVEEGEDHAAAGLIATMIVHVPQSGQISGTTGNSHRQQKLPSWVCQRNMKDFHALNRELMPCSSWLKSMSLPSSTENSGASSFIHFASNKSTCSQNRTEKARTVLQKYMDAVLEDDRLNQSEVIYSFLSPSPSYLKSSDFKQHSLLENNRRSEPKFTFPNLFKSQESYSEEWMADSKDNRTKTRTNLDQDDTSKDVLDDFDTPDIGNVVGDGVAEPLYSFISEIFEIRGVFRILRKSLMTFVQITYGSTINKHIKDTVAWLTSDLMIARCLKTLKLSIWPEVVMDSKEDTPDPLADEIAKAKAKAALIAHLPDWLSTMVGQQSSKMGISKIFDTLQEKTLNKLLIYDLLEVVIYNLFPELVRSYAFQQFRNMPM